MEIRPWMEDPLRAWIVAAIALISGVIVAALAFPSQVYDRLIWQYFWGPVVADAHGARCASRLEGEVAIHRSADQCASAAGIVVTPGYTTFSTIAYAVILLFAIIGVVLLMQRLEIGTDRSLFYALIPYVFLGGSLRVVEDANALLVRDHDEMLIELPWAGMLISPLIYISIFVFAAVTLLACLWLADRGYIDRYELPFAGAGIVAVILTFVILGYIFVTTDIMAITLSVAIISLGGATLIAWGVWVLTEHYWPEVNRGTGLMGAVIVWGHAVDGIANVISLDWADQLGLARSYEPKHVVNAAIQDYTAAIQPAWVTDAIGAVWPFLPVKVGVAVIVVWIFNEESFEDSPNFAMLMLIAILAVGLGPGTRDFLRAALGI